MKRGWMIAFLLLAALSGAALYAQAGRIKVRQGNKLFAEKQYDAALAKYQDALLENPNAFITQFNVGDAVYKKNNWEKALESYAKTLKTEDIFLQSKTYYNIGNTQYRQGKLAESIQSYEQALKLNPNDADAKYNLEFVRTKLKENAKPQNEQQKQQQQQQQQKQQEKEQREKEQAQQQPERKTEMSKEQAEQLMNALNENQKKAKKEQVRGAGGVSVEKDW